MKIFFGLSLSLLAAAAAQAQTTQTQSVPAPAPRAFIELSTSSESTVKGVPFSAEAVSESVQNLSDGNRIVRRSTSKIYRNSQGQFRREGGFGIPGASMGAYFGGENSVVTVFDPVGGNRFWFDTNAKTVNVLRLPRLSGRAPIAIAGSAENRAEKLQAELKARGMVNVQIVPSGSAGGSSTAAVVAASPSEYVKFENKTESLGIQNFDGIDAEGTRTITTIPTGSIGNERPIEIVYERWYSKDLHMTIYSKHSDPRFGEQTYRLTNIDRSEPDPSLFEVPDGYKIVTAPGATTVFRQQSRMKQSPFQTRTAAGTMQVKNATSTASRP
jgi:hypothetical protein